MTKLTTFDVNKLLTDLQNNLDTETGVPNKYQVVASDGSAAVKTPVEMTGLTVVVPEASGGTTDGGELESFAQGQVVFATAQLLATVAMLLPMSQ